MSSKRSIVALSFSVISAVLVAACSGASQGGTTTSCGGESRERLNCDSEVSYQGVETGGEASLFGVGLGADYSDKAIRRINDKVAKYAAAHARLCDEYNKCVIDAGQYHAEATKLRERLHEVARIAKEYELADSYGEKKQLLAQGYATAIPAEERSEEITLSFTLQAELPNALQQIKGGSYALAPNEPLPTGADAVFEVTVSSTAHVYLLQKGPEGGLDVLFPIPQVPFDNPLRPGAKVRIPPGADRFTLDDSDLGTNWIYIVASKQPLQTLQSVATRIASGEVDQISAAPQLAGLTNMAPGTAPAGCTRAFSFEKAGAGCSRSRGFVHKAAGGASLSVTTDPGDDMIVKAFPYRHVPKGDYASAMDRFSSPGGSGQRGIIVED